MYIIVEKDKNDSPYIEEITENWYESIEHFEPIDCVNGEIMIYNEAGRKYFIGPEQKFEKKKLFWKIETVDVGQWNFDKGEPYLIDTEKDEPDNLHRLLIDYAVQKELKKIDIEKLDSKSLIKLLISGKSFKA